MTAAQPAPPPAAPPTPPPEPHWTLPGTTLRQRTSAAVEDTRLRQSLARAVGRFAHHRDRALDLLDDPTALRLAARRIPHDVLERLPELLARFADEVVAAGGHVHWAADAADANAYVVGVARRIGARTVVKGKSMATEETGLNSALQEAGVRPVETDLGEWIIQLAGHTPSHIIAPAVHLDRYQVRDILQPLSPEPLATEPERLAAFARRYLRAEFLAADLGVSGANFGVAETGSIVLVENEGNGRMCTTLPRVHVAMMGMERVVADWAQLDVMINLLARSGTGQHLSTYTNIITGPRRPGEGDGPDEFHVVILDNGRSAVLGSEAQEILACIRCGACLNVCPVYRQIGGHAYGWVYSGPVGAVLTPLLARDAYPKEAAELGSASTLCGACMDACPVSIPLQDLLLASRRRKADTAGTGERAGWRAWAATWRRPLAYRASMKAAARGRSLTRFAAMAPGLERWTEGRAPLVPAGRTFTERWHAGEV